MAAKGPKASMDAGKARPLICVGNRRGETCPDDWLEIFAEELRIAYQFEEDEVTVNRPFRGGYITHAYGGNPIPWLQIEINRSLYLSREWFDKEKGEVQPGRMKELNGRFLDALGRLIQRIQ
jgi:formiminoglutamase